MEIYLAGLTKRLTQLMELEKEGYIVPYVLESYMSFHGSKQALILMDYVKRNNCKFLLDSGAFTFMNTQKHATKNQLYKFLYKYINFIKEYDIELFFELDVDALLGYEEVKKMRVILETQTGKKCIPVFHINRGKEEFLKMVKEYDYVSIGSDRRFNDSIKGYYKWVIKTAHKHGCRIHGLGFTKLTNLNNTEYHFDTVDSTSWSSGGRFGTFYKFDGMRLTSMKNKSDYRIKIASKHEKYNNLELDKQNLREWLKFIKYKEDKY